MQTWQVILLIVGILFLLYTSVEVYVIWSVAGFSNKLKRRLLAVSIVLNERRDVLLAQVDGFRSVSVAFRDSDELVFRQARELDLSKVKAEEVHGISQLLNDAESRFNYLAGKNAWATKTEEFQTLSLTAKDLEANYRQAIMGYNTDLLGYNYWVKIPLCHWIPWLLGWRKKERIG
ncbi:MAG: hypothetical protein J6328_02700 [Bacilli bacterium]|nr:hypothetical protein [Bacilli bacterium]